MAGGLRLAEGVSHSSARDCRTVFLSSETFLGMGFLLGSLEFSFEPPSH